jgi:hypothetical protein
MFRHYSGTAMVAPNGQLADPTRMFLNEPTVTRTTRSPRCSVHHVHASQFSREWRAVNQRIDPDTIKSRDAVFFVLVEDHFST